MIKLSFAETLHSDTAVGITIGYRPLNRRCASVVWQQARMNIERMAGGYTVDEVGRQEEAKGGRDQDASAEGC